MALSSENRLKKSSLISLVCKKGASWKTPFFRIVFIPSSRKKFDSVVVVSKQYDKRAVARNSIRRRINGFLQQHKNFPKISCVIFPYESAKEMSEKDFRKNMAISLEKMTTWKWKPTKRFVQKRNHSIKKI